MNHRKGVAIGLTCGRINSPRPNTVMAVAVGIVIDDLAIQGPLGVRDLFILATGDRDPGWLVGRPLKPEWNEKYLEAGVECDPTVVRRNSGAPYDFVLRANERNRPAGRQIAKSHDFLWLFIVQQPFVVGCDIPD